MSGKNTPCMIGVNVELNKDSKGNFTAGEATLQDNEAFKKCMGTGTVEAEDPESTTSKDKETQTFAEGGKRRKKSRGRKGGRKSKRRSSKKARKSRKSKRRRGKKSKRRRRRK